MVLQGHRWPLVQYTGNTPETNLYVCVCVYMVGGELLKHSCWTCVGLGMLPSGRTLSSVNIRGPASYVHYVDGTEQWTLIHVLCC